ncbi:hypothetical protein [Aquirufa nivalisilvae]
MNNLESDRFIRQAIKTIFLSGVIFEAVKQFQDSIDRANLIATQKLLKDFSSTVIDDNQGIIGEISFNAYGRFQDMKNVQWNFKKPPVDELEKWISVKGISNFAWIAGYEKTGRVPSESLAMKKIAWAISHSMQNGDAAKNRKGRSWYNKTKVRIMNNIAEKVSKEINNQLVNRMASSISGTGEVTF